MTPYPSHPLLLLVVALVFGFWGDLILRENTLGLNLSLWIIPLIALIPWRAHRDNHPLSFLSKLFLTIAVALSLVPLWRDSGTLTFLSCCGMVLALALAASHYYDFDVFTTQPSRLVRHLFFRGGASLFAFFIAFPVLNQTVQVLSEKHFRLLPGLIRGALLSIPLILIFLGLFMSADKNYATMIHNLPQFDPGWILSHGLMVGIFSWMALGLLSLFFLVQFDTAPTQPNTQSQATHVIEINVILTLINLLFMTYVYFQLGYLFGGIEHVLNTANLTLAEYARSGFFESALVAALVLIMLLIFDELLQWSSPKARKLFSALALVQITLVLIVILSGMQRMAIYKDSFGLTEDRFYVNAILVWMLLTFVAFGLTFLGSKKRPNHFMLNSILMGFAGFFVVVIINPHAHIASVNIKRMMEGKKFDPHYANQLSADATPVIIKHLNHLPHHDRQIILRDLEKRDSLYRKNNTRLSWSYPRHKAHTLIQAERSDP